ncbi:hypothetical protein [Bacteroides caecimuris]|uniref:hypothetical protein n=1 Tax=Bacteroides caecimuris TaxID=1796613 RepID=UPI0026E51FAC|nr:hypothetical protein [Bacteroides caecimuris]
MKILLLGFSKMKYMPYASFYLDNIDFNINDVEIVCWDRDMKKEDRSSYNSKIVFHDFTSVMDNGIERKSKIKHFLAYRKFVNNLINRNKYDFIISLHTLPGLLLLDKLLTKFKKRYILDYRDSTFEENSVFGFFVRRLALGAKTVFVSSDEFRRFLPDKKVMTITSHNILADSLKHREDRRQHYIPSSKIRISFWGFIRHKHHNKLIIDRLANDPRFELHYYGREQETALLLKAYAKSKSADNIFFHGEYQPKDRYAFSCVTDIIHNSYDDANMRLAMGNKYYDGVIFRIPLLCMPGSFMAKRCIEVGVGFAFDPHDPNYADKIFDCFNTIDRDKFESNCDNDLANILNEYNYGTETIRNILNKKTGVLRN